MNRQRIEDPFGGSFQSSFHPDALRQKSSETIDHPADFDPMNSHLSGFAQGDKGTDVSISPFGTK